jgi:beta-lactam-binding protein with PASTA domain
MEQGSERTGRVLGGRTGRAGLRRSRRFRGRMSRVDLRWTGWIVGVVTAAFLLGYGATALFFFPGTDRPPIVAVPDVRQMSEAEARSALEPLDLELEVGDSLPNPQVPAGRVLSQTPLAGQEVAPGSPVRVMLSGGAERTEVPVVASMNRDQAVAVLEASGFQVTVAEVEDLRAEGRVVGTEPAAGSRVPVPSRIRVEVSTGPPMVQVPDLAGLDQEKALELLGDAGLRLGEVEFRFSGFFAEEAVIWQNPPSGAAVPKGSSVRVRLATDSVPAPSPQ